MSTGGFAAWTGDLEASFEAVARSALGAEAFEVAARHERTPALHGAFLGLVGPTGAIQIGLASDEAGCQALARGLLAMTEADGPLPDTDLADAMCEIVNIVAGDFKARLRDRVAGLQLGLPVFIKGSVQATEQTAVRVAEVRIGAVPAAVLLVHPRDGAGAGE
jgi:CheY-specific phosphatase CheX